MLSILVPIYNFNVKELIPGLVSQCDLLQIKYEIICIDDCSESQFETSNRKHLTHIKNVYYNALSSNIGRAKIRNSLALKANYDYLLFLDCDSKIVNKDFIGNYLQCIKDDLKTVYGGRIYLKEDNTPSHALHYKFGKEREEISVQKRKQKPYRFFLSNNFLIQKEIYLSIKSDEKIKGYGYEDAAFAQQLKKRNIPIDHINNPIAHVGLEINEIFIEKTKNAIKNLALLVKTKKVDREEIKVFRYYKKLKRLRIHRLYYFLFHKWEPFFIQNLTSSKPKLIYFDFFKLYLLCKHLEP